MKEQNNFLKYLSGLALSAPLLFSIVHDVLNKDKHSFVLGMTLWIMATLIIGTIISFIATRAHDKLYRLAVAAALGTSLLLVWANGAVGVIGSEDNDINKIYNLIPLVGFIGALFVRFQSKGMAYTMITTALIMAVIAGAIIINANIQGSGFPLPIIIEILGLHGFFAAGFSFSALLFYYSGRRQELLNTVEG